MLRVYGHLFEGVQESLTADLDELRRRTAKAARQDKVVALRSRPATS
jgi:hypothetical protein